MGDGIAHFHLLGVLDATDDIAHIPSAEFLAGNHIHLQHPNLVGIVFHACIEELHMVALTDDTIGNLEVGNDAAKGVEYRIEDKRLQGCLLITLGMRDALNDGIEYLLDPLARLARGTDNVLAVAAYQVDDLVLHLVRHGRGHIYLVDDRDNLQVMVNGHIEVGDGLRLHTLCGIHHQQCSLAGSDGTRHLIGEVDMSWGINQIENIFFALVHIPHLDGVALDGDATLTLQVHVIKHLSFGDLDGLGEFQHSVS